MRYANSAVLVGVLSVVVAVSQSSSAQQPSRPPVGPKAAQAPKRQAPRAPTIAQKLKALDAVAEQFIEPLDENRQTYDLLVGDLTLAIRCGYDVDVLVHGSPVRFRGEEGGRLFRIRTGVYSVSIAADPYGLMERTRYGLCRPANAKDAFAMGLLFFLTEPTLGPDNSLQYTLLSDPEIASKYPEQRAFEVLHIENHRDGTFRRNEMPPRINLTIEPQTRVIGLRDFTDQHTGSLTIMTAPFGTKWPLFQSNDLDLAAIWKARRRE